MSFPKLIRNTLLSAYPLNYSKLLVLTQGSLRKKNEKYENENYLKIISAYQGSQRKEKWEVRKGEARLIISASGGILKKIKEVNGLIYFVIAHYNEDLCTCTYYIEIYVHSFVSLSPIHLKVKSYKLKQHFTQTRCFHCSFYKQQT